MSYAAAIAALEQEQGSLERRLAQIGSVLDNLKEIAGDVDAPRMVGKKKRAAKKDRQTDRQTEQASRQRAARSLPDVTTTKGAANAAAILTMLKKHGGSMTPGELARALKIERPTLRYQLKPMEKSKQVVASGNTGNRRISLPGAAPKEVP